MDIDLKRITHISFPDLGADMQDITSGIDAGSLYLEEILMDGGLNFGECNANRLEFSIYGIGDVSNERIVVYQTDDSARYPVFDGYVDSCKLDNFGYFRKIVAYDAIQYKGSLSIANWWVAFWAERDSATLKEIRESVCDYLEIPYDADTELFNDDLVVIKTVAAANMQFRDLMRMICELQLCFPNINRSGQMEYVVLDNTPKDIKGLYETGNSEFEDYVTAVIDDVQITDADNVIHSLTENARNPYSINGNIFLYSFETEEEIQAIAESILEKIRDISYVPAKINMIVSDLSLQLGEYLTTDHGNVYAFRNVLSGSLLVEQEISAGGDEYLSGDGTSYNADIQRIVKKTEDLTANALAAKLIYYSFSNAQKITVGRDEVTIISLKILTTDQTSLIFLGNVNLSAVGNKKTVSEAVKIGEEETTIEYETTEDMIVRVSYKWDNGSLQYYPTETYRDGKHVLPLIYTIEELKENLLGKFEVTMSCQNGTVTIDPYDIIASCFGQGLAASGTFWDGTIELSEIIPTIALNNPAGIVTKGIRESITAATQVPIGDTISEVIPSIILSKPAGIIVNGITESIEIGGLNHD